MSDLMFSSVFGTADSLVSSVSASSFLLCSVVSIVLGLVIAGVYMFRLGTRRTSWLRWRFCRSSCRW